MAADGLPVARTDVQITGLKELAVENITFDNVRIQAHAGMTCTSAKDLAFRDVVIDTDKGPALTMTNCSSVDTRLSTLVKYEGVPLVVP